jgi:hypothetical protein
MGASLLLLTWFATAGQFDHPVGEISGTAVNGSAGDVPVAGAEVVLRASQDGAFVPVAVGTTDDVGRFSFKDLSVDQGLMYLPGVNHVGIHYPGPRVRLTPDQSTAHVRLIAYDTVSSPSPLISRRHVIGVKSGEGYLEVTETVVVENPSLATFVGQALNDRPPVTLRVSLPDGIEKVTFDREFHGRNFQLHDGKLFTELPWPPGSRELKFLYRVPVEQRFGVLARVLDLPTEQVVVEVTTNKSDAVACNLSRAAAHSGQQVSFEQRGNTLPAGHQIVLQLGAVPLRFETYARWLAVAVLVALVAGSAWAARGWRPVWPANQESTPPQASRQSGTTRRRIRKPHRSTATHPQ